MSLVKRVSQLELKNRQPDIALIALKEGKAQEEALQRCYPGDKPKVVLFLDKWDLLA